MLAWLVWATWVAADDACSGHGAPVAPASSMCVCDAGWLRSNCSLAGVGGGEYGRYERRFRTEWARVATAAGPALRLRMTTNQLQWWGVIFNVGYDGMTDGDCWMMVVSDNGFPFATDRYSNNGRGLPSIDSQQVLPFLFSSLLHPSCTARQRCLVSRCKDLVDVYGYRNSTHQVIEFTRLINTGDPADDILAIDGTESSSILKPCHCRCRCHHFCCRCCEGATR